MAALSEYQSSGSSSSPRPSPTSQEPQTEGAEQEKVVSGGDYVLTFGKHKGKKLSEDLDSYLKWLASDTAYKAPALQAALRDLGMG